MEAKDSLPYSQEPTIGPYIEPTEFNTKPHTVYS
jgi:hypothetical protein